MANPIATVYQGEERRESPRTPLCLPMAVECDAWMDMCHSRDISASGVFLISQRIPSVSTGFSVEMHLPGGLGPVRLGATAIRVQSDHPRGFALRWKNLDKGSAETLGQLWQRWSKAFPSERA